jgi:hypothetical protein
MSINTTDLVNLGEIAAQAWDECDVALEQLNEGFGRPYEAAKDNLLRDVKLAEQEGLDLSIFSGENSRFKFKQHNTNIVIRVHRKPTAHTKLEKLAAKIASLESELKLAKLKLKHEAEQLVLSGQCDNVTEKVVLAFSRIK